MTTHGDDPPGTPPSPNAPTRLDATAPPPPADHGPLPLNTTFAGRYHVKRRIGTGGMGAVYQAFDTVLAEDVAIKLIRLEIVADPQAAADVERRFKRELLMGRRVSHPSVVRVHDIGEAQGLRYLTMSFVDGQDLARVLEAHGPMSPSRVVRIGRRLGGALAAVHAAGVIHRDLKPANVMLGRGDQVWLTDFGIARLVGEAMDGSPALGTPVLPGSPRLGTLTTLGARVGTPEYMAPEQAAGGRVDERTDVYGLALVLYDLLTGGARRQRYGNAETELQARGRAAPHVRVQVPEVPAALDAALARALDPEPAQRYASAAALVDALAAIDEAETSGGTTRRAGGTATGEDSIRFGNAEIRPGERQLLVDGQPTGLGSRAFDVLLALVERRERVVPKNELLDLVWPDTVVEENDLQSQVSQLRKLLGPQAISTIPGRGYRFTAVVDEVPSALSGTAAAQRAASAPAGGESARPATTVLRTNLPAVLPSLFGRDDDLLALGALIDRHRDDHRLITIAGAGGIGKTRLAQTLLQARTGAFAHGVCFVDLAPVTDPRLISDTIATALGVPTAGGDPTEALTRTVAPLEILILLDNAEHLLDEVARIASLLMASAPGLQLLVTSQAPLKIANERIYRLGALALPDDEVVVEEALTFGAVALFVDRAQAADRRFALDAGNVETVIDICRRLDGLPLALEFAAARVPLLGVHKLSTSLNERFRLLTAGSRGAPARQQTLRAALEWSHGLASTVEQVVFRRLGVLAGSSTLELVQQVVADDAIDAWTAVEALGGLVDRSLVSVSADEPPRYRLLDSPRVFARERLEAAGEFDTIAARHARAMRSLFESTCDSLIRSNASSVAAFATMDADLDNALAALQWAQLHDAETAASLMAAVGVHLALTGSSEGFPEHMIPADMPLWRLPCGLVSLWSWTTSRGRVAGKPAVREAADRAAAYARSDCDVPALCVALASLAESLTPGSREAAAVFDELHALDAPNTAPLARCAGPIAEATHRRKLGDLPGAIACMQQGLALISETGVRNGVWIVQSWLIGVNLVAGHTAAVLADGLPLLKQLQGTRNEMALSVCRRVVVTALLANDDLPRARPLAQAGWRQDAARNSLQAHAAWPELLALLAALERRPHTAARLLGWSDAGWGRSGRERGPISLAVHRRAESIARGALGDEAFARFRKDGASLRWEDVDAIAFDGGTSCRQ